MMAFLGAGSALACQGNDNWIDMFLGEEDVVFYDLETSRQIAAGSPREARNSTGHVTRCDDQWVIVYHTTVRGYVKVQADRVITRHFKGMQPPSGGTSTSRPLGVDGVRKGHSNRNP
jgi:hypothetical protein